MKENALVGKTITSVWLAKDNGAMRFVLDDGTDVIARADGDCCSHTWIESFDTPDFLLGTVASVDNLDMPDLGSPEEYDVVAYYGCKITTDKGACVIDYRNESNGYYGGNLSWPGDYHYGGVYGQNNSGEDWKIVAGEAS